MKNKNKTRVAGWVQKLVEDVAGPCKMEIGKIVKHPDGYKVKIIDGQYWGTYGISNFWYYKRILKNGKLGREQCGYGWM